MAEKESKVDDYNVVEEAAHSPISFSNPHIGQEGHYRTWIRFLTWLKWYPKDMPYLEKKLILKLDLLILVFGCLSFFTKYLDQQAITNAYVS
jgi:ACS family pantothenate transporter-like MFS transporter